MGSPYGVHPITASGGVPTDLYRYAVLTGPGSLPPGLAIREASAGLPAILWGTPTTSGPFGFTITATDANGCPGTQDYSGTVAGAATPIPTLSEWGLMIFMALTALVSTLYLRRAA